jgi:hypothetical protein
MQLPPDAACHRIDSASLPSSDLAEGACGPTPAPCAKRSPRKLRNAPNSLRAFRSDVLAFDTKLPLERSDCRRSSHADAHPHPYLGYPELEFFSHAYGDGLDTSP